VGANIAPIVAAHSLILRGLAATASAMCKTLHTLRTLGEVELGRIALRQHPEPSLMMAEQSSFAAVLGGALYHRGSDTRLANVQQA
jgi:hypothetical protein